MRKSDKNRTKLFDKNFNTLLANMVASNRRVQVIRVDLRFPKEFEHNGLNQEISQFHKNLCQRYRDQGINVGYHTVREQATSHNPHYHTMIFLNGDKVRSAYGVKKVCGEIWNKTVGFEGDGLVHHCAHKPEHSIPALEMINRPSRKATGEELKRQKENFDKSCEIAHKHAEYLNKSYSKGKAPHRVREVFTSQIRD
ncbi:YagK/YfjJ domain-containing protein [Terasakiella pusilla]|uniref:YagK/YfjJ domain-containing protein n=1 Tax=Terasakiella pusilla TaxID=64973 RepID=UPI003AA9974E